MSAPKTNTLIVAHLPTSAFSDISTMRALHALFARYGQLYAFAPIKVFRRCIVTYWNPADAERCKRDVDGLVLPTTPTPAQIRVFRGANTPLRRPSSRPVSPSQDGTDPFYLAPPRLEKNFLISPPGSPPVGWEPVVEDPPNADPLANDLIAALHKLELARSESFGPGGGVTRQGSKGTMEIVYDAPDGVGVGITVSVVDCDRPESEDEAEDEDLVGGGQDEWVYGHRAGFTASGERARFVPTAMPPAGGPLGARPATPLPPLRG
ncbi:Calcipressin-domain-containing protein [Auriculariales sp. MPI-PUGE-AT-0066]|nr:Calcipressin-domain-containing protein [Auriculariales sp. MPI-PUGE-AT-0066]